MAGITLTVTPLGNESVRLNALAFEPKHVCERRSLSSPLTLIFLLFFYFLPLSFILTLLTFFLSLQTFFPNQNPPHFTPANDDYSPPSFLYISPFFSLSAFPNDHAISCTCRSFDPSTLQVLLYARHTSSSRHERASIFGHHPWPSRSVSREPLPSFKSEVPPYPYTRRI